MNVKMSVDSQDAKRSTPKENIIANIDYFCFVIAPGAALVLILPNHAISQIKICLLNKHIFRQTPFLVFFRVSRIKTIDVVMAFVAVFIDILSYQIKTSSAR